MENEQQSTSDANQSPVYIFKIKGHLGQQWVGGFEGLGLIATLEEDGNTVLSGPVVDQAALHGILKKIRDLGMPLLSINSIGHKQQDKSE